MMFSMKDLWRREIHQALGQMAPCALIQIDKHNRMGLGHYASPILLAMAPKFTQAPMTLGLKLKPHIPSCVALTPPGFLNFCCQATDLWQWLLTLQLTPIHHQPCDIDECRYQQRRLDLLLSPFSALAQASLSDCLELSHAEYQLGLLLMEAIDSWIHMQASCQKNRLLLLKGIDDYLNQMVFFSERQAILRGRYFLLTFIRDFLLIGTPCNLQCRHIIL